MAEIRLAGINKVYPNGTHAVQDVDLHIADGEFMIMVGPSGCAKSTILRMIAGLETPTTGTVEIGGRVVNDVAPKDRDIAMVFQSYALYPHMTVRENLAFGLKLRKMSPTEIEQRVGDAARILGLEDLLDRLPKQMSGGQRQRVAMGRAIVREPQAFLMDEPLSNLDAKLRVQMRTEIAKLHQRLQTTTVYVTHDQVEAMTLGQRICILRKGVVQQVDTPYMVYTNPSNVFVGGFIGSPGMNFMYGTLLVQGEHVFLQLGEACMPLPASVTARLMLTGSEHGTAVVVGIRPEHLREATGTEPPGGALAVHVELTETMGSESFAYFNTEVAQPDLSDLSDTQAVSNTFVAKLTSTRAARAGAPLLLVPQLEHVHLFDPATQLSLLAPVAEHEYEAHGPAATFVSETAPAGAPVADLPATAPHPSPAPASNQPPVVIPHVAAAALQPAARHAAEAGTERAFPRPAFRANRGAAPAAAHQFAGTVRGGSAIVDQDPDVPTDIPTPHDHPAGLPPDAPAPESVASTPAPSGTDSILPVPRLADAARIGGTGSDDAQPKLFQGTPLFGRSVTPPGQPGSDS